MLMFVCPSQLSLRTLTIFSRTPEPKIVLCVSVYLSIIFCFQEINSLEHGLNRAELWTTALIYFGDMNKTSGIIFHSGSEYKALRRFTLKTLRDLGFGKHSSEEIILEECECMKT